MNGNVPDVVLSIPEKCTTWSLPTPPPSLSELSTLAATQDSLPGRPRGPQQSQRPSFSHVEGFQDIQAQTHRGTLLPTVQPATSNLISANSVSLNSSSNWPWFNSISAMSGIGLARRRFALAVTAFSGSSAMPTFTNPLAWRPRLAGVGAWLALYLLCNLALTLHNKRLLGVFPFPWTLTAVHAFSAAVGSWVCAWRGVFKPVPLNHPTTPLLALFSVLYSANIAASNASLRLVSIATHQVIRAATPLFVVLFTWASQFNPGLGSRGKLGVLRSSAVSSAKLKSLTPVVLGVVFATYGDYTYTRAGLALTLLGTALAALKTMLASKVVRAPTPTSLTTSTPTLPTTHSRPSHAHSTHFKRHSMTGYTHVRRTSAKRFEDIRIDEGYLSGDERLAQSKADSRTSVTETALHPLDVLFRLSPLACVQCLIVAWMSGEVGQWSTIWSTPVQAGVWVWSGMVPMLVLNGALAFVLNYVSFVASRRAGALSMTVAANVKQVLTVLLALLVFESGTPSLAHVLGIALTLAGGVWYGRVEAQERREHKERGLGRRERGKSLGGQEKLGV